MSEAGDGGRSETQPGWTLTAPSTFRLTWPVIGWAWSGLGCTWARMRGRGWSQMQSHLRPWDPAQVPLGDLVLRGQIPSKTLCPPVPLACSADRHSQPLPSRVDLSLLLPAWRLPPRQVPPPRTALPCPSPPGALRLPGHLPERLSLHVFRHLVGRGSASHHPPRHEARVTTWLLLHHMQLSARDAGGSWCPWLVAASLSPHLTWLLPVSPYLPLLIRTVTEFEAPPNPVSLHLNR